MRKLLASILAAFALVVWGTAYAGSPCAGYSNCDDNQVNAQAQGQLQGQQQGQLQGQLQGQQQGMQQGQIGINKNYNSDYNYNKNYSSNKNYTNSKAVAVQGQLQGNKQAANNTTTIKSDASGNAVAAFAPSLSTRSTTNCITTYSATGGAGGTGTIFSLGLTLPIRDEDCVQEQAVRTGFESNIPEAQELALELYRHQMTTIMEREGHITAAAVLDADGNVQKVAYSQDLKAFVPMEQHPKFQEAAARHFARAMLANGYKPNISAVGGSGFQQVSFPTAGGAFGTYSVNMNDDDLIDSVQDLDDDDESNGWKFTPTTGGIDGN